MPVAVGPDFLKALASSDQTRIVSAQVWNGTTPLAELGTVMVGDVQVDATAQIRRTCSLTVESQGLGLDELVPDSPKSLLHPGAGNELRLFRGFDYDPSNPKTWQQRIAVKAKRPAEASIMSADGTVEMCPLGVFRMTRPVVTDTGDSITIELSGNDRSALVTARKWRDVYPIGAGTDLRTAVNNLLTSRIPDLGINFEHLAPTYGVTVPATSFGTDLAGSNDPMADTMTLATAAAMELFFDVYGNPVMQPIPTPENTASSFGTLYEEGRNCTMTEAGRVFDETTSYNGVIVIGVGTGGAPVRAEVWDTDPSSPTWVGGPWGYQPYIYQTSLVPSSSTTTGEVAYSQALKMAQKLFIQVRALLDVPQFQCIPNPALLESDGFTLVRQRIALDAEYIAGQLTIPLDTSSAEAVTCRPQGVVAPKPKFKLGKPGGRR